MSRAPAVSRKPVSLISHGAIGRHWIYAIGFLDGLTKIGRTQHPRSRVGQLYGEAKGRVAWVHLFAPFSAKHVAAAVERGARTRAARVATHTVGLEWFGGMQKPDVLRCVREAARREAAVQADVDAD